MKKLLYVTASSKPEDMSVSKKTGREFVNRFMAKNSVYSLEELDLYSEYIPELTYKLYKNRAEVVSGSEYNELNSDDKKAVDRINALCDQFLSADTYVIAAPMWSVSFPSILKRYIDCVIQNNKVIKISPKKVKGLLDDRERNMVYIQSSGGIYPKILGGKVNHGVDYFHDIFKFLGVKKFEKILVEGVDMPDVGEEQAMKNAYEDIDDVIEVFMKEPILRV